MECLISKLHAVSYDDLFGEVLIVCDLAQSLLIWLELLYICFNWTALVLSCERHRRSDGHLSVHHTDTAKQILPVAPPSYAKKTINRPCYLLNRASTPQTHTTTDVSMRMCYVFCRHPWPCTYSMCATIQLQDIFYRGMHNAGNRSLSLFPHD